MTEQLFTDGDVIQPTGSVQLECVSASYTENEQGEKSNFAYTFRLKSELDTERKAEKQRAEEAAAQADEAAPAEPTEPVNQPEPIEEETQHVR